MREKEKESILCCRNWREVEEREKERESIKAAGGEKESTRSVLAERERVVSVRLQRSLSHIDKGG